MYYIQRFLLFIFCFLSFQWNLKAEEEESMPDTLIVGYTSAAPFIIASEDELYGINIWLWEKIADDLEIPYRLEKMNFRAMLKALEEGTIDLSINPLTITSDRSKHMNFTHTFYASNSTVATTQSSAFSKFKSFLQSFFSINFWRGFLLLIVIIGIFGLLTWWFERKVNPQQFRTGLSGIWDGLWWSAVTMTTVGYGDKSPKTSAGKIVALIWMFTAVMFISGFTASVASSLTVNQLNWNPQGVNDFKDKEIGTVKSSGTFDYFKTHLFKNVGVYDGVEEGLNALLEGELEAFLYDEPILRYRLVNDKRYKKLEILPIKFDLQFYAFAFSEGHEAMEKAVSQKILELTEGMEWRIILAEYELSEL